MVFLRSPWFHWPRCQECPFQELPGTWCRPPGESTSSWSCSGSRWTSCKASPPPATIRSYWSSADIKAAARSPPSCTRSWSRPPARSWWSRRPCSSPPWTSPSPPAWTSTPSLRSPEGKVSIWIFWLRWWPFSIYPKGFPIFKACDLSVHPEHPTPTSCSVLKLDHMDAIRKVNLGRCQVRNIPTKTKNIQEYSQKILGKIQANKPPRRPQGRILRLILPLPAFWSLTSNLSRKNHSMSFVKWCDMIDEERHLIKILFLDTLIGYRKTGC